MVKVSPYNNSLIKRTFDIAIAMVGITFLVPVYVLLFVYTSISGNWPILFIQERIGKKGKPFKVLKFRTMVSNAEKMQKSLIKKNEADGPVFKIYNDPRYTKIGRFLAHTGIDEIPQFVNVIKGEMSVVGPRPLPVYEAVKVIKTHKQRFMIKPGITSTWVTSGSHTLDFNTWMRLDLAYVKETSFLLDISIVARTLGVIVFSLVKIFQPKRT